MELLQTAKDRRQQKYVKDFLFDYHFEVIALTENIGHRASIYIAEYSLGNGLREGDALIAATATENIFTLCTSNKKHFHSIHDLKLQVFVP